LGLLRAGYGEGKKRRFLKKGSVTVARIEELIRLRDKARLEKHWQEADRIRDELNQQGIMLEDTAEGTMWKIK
jgi:cysteinyl-tRNA synthetase